MAPKTQKTDAGNGTNNVKPSNPSDTADPKDTIGPDPSGNVDAIVTYDTIAKDFGQEIADRVKAFETDVLTGTGFIGGSETVRAIRIGLEMVALSDVMFPEDDATLQRERWIGRIINRHVDRKTAERYLTSASKAAGLATLLYGDEINPKTVGSRHIASFPWFNVNAVLAIVTVDEYDLPAFVDGWAGWAKTTFGTKYNGSRTAFMASYAKQKKAVAESNKPNQSEVSKAVEKARAETVRQEKAIAKLNETLDGLGKLFVDTPVNVDNAYETLVRRGIIAPIDVQTETFKSLAVDNAQSFALNLIGFIVNHKAEHNGILNVIYAELSMYLKSLQPAAEKTEAA